MFLPFIWSPGGGGGERGSSGVIIKFITYTANIGNFIFQGVIWDTQGILWVVSRYDLCSTGGIYLLQLANTD